MVKPVEKPTAPDNLTQNEAQTAQLLAECAAEQQRLQNRLGQYQGRMEIIGSAEDLRLQHKRLSDRIARLEDTYTALTIAQETLQQARSELQRRFAPRITQRAQELLAAMTDGRYRSLTMGEDFSLQAAAGQEDVLCDAIWRSAGTISTSVPKEKRERPRWCWTTHWCVLTTNVWRRRWAFCEKWQRASRSSALPARAGNRKYHK